MNQLLVAITIYADIAEIQSDMRAWSDITAQERLHDSLSLIIKDKQGDPPQRTPP